MTVLSAQSLRHRAMFTPWVERTVHTETGTSYGLSHAGYDVRIREAMVLCPGAFALASTLEHFNIPTDILCTIHDKSSLARRGLAVQTTIAEPGWRGYLTLELTNHKPPWRWTWPRILETVKWYLCFCPSHRPPPRRRYALENEIRLIAGQPIAQIIAHQLDEHTKYPYFGKYMDQPPVPVPHRKEEGIPA